MSSYVYILPSKQINQVGVDGPENKTLNSLRQKIEQTNSWVECELSGADAQKQFENSFWRNTKLNDHVQIIAFSASGDFLLEWLEMNQNAMDQRNLEIVLIGTFPNRKYKFYYDKIKIFLIYGSEDHIAYVDEADLKGSLDFNSLKIFKPEEYLEEQLKLIQYKNFKIVEGLIVEGDHFLFSTNLDNSLDKIVDLLIHKKTKGLSSKEEKHSFGIKNFGLHAQHFQKSSIHRNPSTANMLKTILKLNTNDNYIICDIGCGAGHWGAILADLNDHVTFLDPSIQMLEKAKETARQLNLSNVDFVVNSAENISLGSEKYDLVTTRLALHHFLNVKTAISEMFRLTKKAGLVAICDLQAPDSKSLRVLQNKIEALHDRSHIRTYQAAQLKHIIEKNGGQIVQLIENQWESREGISLEEWFNFVGTPIDNISVIEEILHGLNSEELSYLGFSRSNKKYHYHANTVTIVAKKVDNICQL